MTSFLPFVDCTSCNLHPYSFEVLNRHLDDNRRVVRSHLPPEMLGMIGDVGAVVLKNAICDEQIEELRQAVDNLLNTDVARPWRRAEPSRSYGGIYLRNVHAFDTRFLPLLDDLPIVGNIRALIGPRIRLRSYSARITGFTPNEATRWHRDQRSSVVPRPVLFTDPHVIVALVYLDSANHDTGRLGLIPGSHRWVSTLPEHLGFEDSLPGAINLEVDKGTVVLVDAALYHRALPHLSTAQRRVLILHFGPSYFVEGESTPLPPEPAFASLLKAAQSSGDSATLEIFGYGGPM